MPVLDAILDAKRSALPALRQRRLPRAPSVRAFDLARESGAPLKLCAEIKRRSPSAGVLSSRLTVAERAQSYERAGASLVSVLTDGPFFSGRFEDLAEARGACELPILCKDFVLDECQLDLARAFGADAVLLIVRCLSESRLKDLLMAAHERALTALVEVATRGELSTALASGAQLIGVNARDLDTLQVDAVRARALVAAVPRGAVCVHLSGISTPALLSSVAEGRADAALIGEALMRQDDPEALLRSFCERARSPSTVTD